MALMATTTIGPTITSQRIRPHFSRVRVNLNGEETEKAFDDVVSNLAHAAPPIPGFCRMKGGKLLQVFGRDHVAKFLIDENVGITIGDSEKGTPLLNIIMS
ncbi:uncharacterized protein LOC113462762 isoform X2 [Phoenix dactylifera]|uniref:Uncharacterized protein LOC113462762 isoform X2 n=1 Tax=Phoenix dactylifera TaxID=42345 RepID=A0A8B9ACE4_PHODC|nr:uncharacterized protein LOC113462762 isoform X2 [Phoenix dactylifera]